MANENNDKKIENIYSKKIRAGKRRTYFFDVRTTRSNDYYLTITESCKRPDDTGYDRHKIFLYKEDFNKFIKALGESMNYVKTELMPDFDFDAFNHDETPDEYNSNGASRKEEIVNGETTVVVEKVEEMATPPATEPGVEVDNTKSNTQEEVDKW